MQAITKIGTALGIRAGEGEKVLRLGAVFAQYVFALLLARSVRDSLFLSAGYSKALAWMYVGVAGTVIASAMLVKRLPQPQNPVRNAQTTSFVFALSYGVFYLALQSETMAEPAIVGLYFWVEIMTAFLMIRFWNITNSTFNSRQAKRLYSLITSGQVLGNIACGAVAGALAPVLGTSSLLLIVAFALLLSNLLLANRMPGTPKQETKQTGSAAKPVRSLRKESSEIQTYGKYVLALALLTYLTASLVDFQFKLSANAHYSSDELTSFFGMFYGIVGTAAFLVQLGLANRIVSWLGLFGTLSIMPFGFVIVGIGRLFVPTFGLSMALKFDEHLLRYSLNDPLSQLLLIPLPARSKQSLQQTIGGVVKPAAVGVAGLVAVGLGSLAASDGLLSVIAGAIAVLSSIGLLVLLLVRSNYIRILAQATEHFQRINLSHPNLLDSPETARHLEQVLRKQTGKALHVGLLAVEATRSQLPTTVYEPLVTDDSIDEADRARALWQIYRSDPARCLPLARELASHPDTPLLAGTALLARIGAGDRSSQSWVRQIQAGQDPDMAIRFLQVLASPTLRASNWITSQAVDFAMDMLLDGQIDRNQFRQLATLAPLDELIRIARERLGEETLQHNLQTFLYRLFDWCHDVGTPESDTLALEELAYAALDRGNAQARRSALRWLLGSSDTTTIVRDLAQAHFSGLHSQFEVPTDFRGPLWLPQASRSWVISARAALIQALLSERKHDKTIQCVEWEYWTRNTATSSTECLADLADLDVTPWIEELQAFLQIAPPENAILNQSVQLAVAQRFCSLTRWAAAQSGSNELLHTAQISIMLQAGSRTTVAELLDQTLAHPRKKDILALFEPVPQQIALDAAGWIQLPWDPHTESITRHTGFRLLGGKETTEEIPMQTVDRILQLANVELFQNLPIQSLAKIAEITENVDYATDTFIIEDGAEGDSLYLLASGTVEVRKNEKTLVALNAGACFGEMSLLDDQPRSADVVAAEACTCLRIWRDDFEVLLLDEPQISRSIMHVLTHRLRMANAN